MKKDPISFFKRCRLCGRCHRGSLDIFSRKDRNLKELIKQCLHINVREDDSLPKKLCQFCEKKLYLWEKFKNSCDKVQVKLIADSLPNEFDFPIEEKGDKLCDEEENTSHILSKDVGCYNSFESFRDNHKQKPKRCISKSINLSSEKKISIGIDEEILNSKIPDGIKKSNTKKEVSCESIFSNTAIKRNQNFVSSVDLNSVTSKCEGNCDDADKELKTNPTKNSQFTDQDISDLNDTLSKNIISDRTLCTQENENANKLENTVDEELTNPYVTETQYSISSGMKCSESIPSEKVKIHPKSSVTEEVKNAIKSGPLQCPLCPRKLSTTYNLNHHLDTHSEKCNYCCHLCGKLFRTRSSLSNHMRVHLFDDAENISKGNKRFSETSSSVRLFQCEICDKKFRQSGHLSYHLKMHTGMRSHSCSECGKCFAEKYQLRRHENAVHNKIKRYTCDVCGKQFLHTHNFKDHKLQHEGIANISCDLCGKTFLTSNSLSRHQRLHTGVKPFVCDICGKKFRDCSNRKRHRDKHSEEEKQGLLRGEEIIQVTQKESKVKKTYMNLKTYFESNDEVSLKEDGKEGMLNNSVIASGNPELLHSMSNDSSNPNPLLDCGLFEEEIDLNSDGLLLIGDGRIDSGGSEFHKDQLVWVPSSDLNRDECLENICGADEDVGIQMGLCGMQSGDITGILEVGMGLCSDFDVGTGIDLAKDGLSHNFPSIGDMKEAEEEKSFDNVLHLQVF